MIKFYAGLVAAISIALFLGTGYESQYIFSPEEMRSIAKEAIAEGEGDINKIVDGVVDRLRAAHPGYVNEDPHWIFNNAGGAMGSMLVLHASFSEYVIIFGTAVGTEGHTGRFLAEDYFTILSGEQWAHSLGDLHKEVYKPGDQHFLPRGTSKQYKMPDECWALEYARGNIASMLPFGTFDTFFSTLDVVTLARTVRVSAQGMLGNFFLRGKV
uniref:C-8 sterol isomerase n=1 Tax=Tetraselmis sp. GSL018 TaxID=582737 RepID=A0A061QYG9_9CHLO|mmetsp:Transcript_37869/g.89936  ORF Transcript_37869/g.89936 Transcript_37869/m.89936 type:complete len:213 (+) Transcript_37869:100-738(+)|eukprot:CAMPEP_0177603356 /NCGR_PEP_ID=MMETSP0419_2-20121207/15464_1 /TAXON_ID=582737 /ORGANISM="Tetraselmis sp., Strain GSL018" /LENGTH=212 /DNA_ID=CAMNT_0019097113 /DNA_START=59 /DNA_END=697 /DNA_ORIENTATION=+